jgi:hypothetical protein
MLGLLLSRTSTHRDWLTSVVKQLQPIPRLPTFPTVFHITHWKAGSQWLRKILMASLPGRVAVPERYPVELRRGPLPEARAYPALCMTHEEFTALELPPRWRRLVVLRDLRDTLISAYFSIKTSHPLMGNPTWDRTLLEQRAKLRSCSLEDGLVYLMDHWLPDSARIQSSWAAVGEPFVRYEDLLQDDLGILNRVLLDDFQLPISRQQLRNAILRCRFERLSGGRKRGQEDVASHERKGIAGDWVNYFSDRCKDAFKERFGGTLIATGYEQDHCW